MKDFMNMQYTFIGRKGNIGNTWFEAAQAFGLKFQRRSLRFEEAEYSGG